MPTVTLMVTQSKNALRAVVLLTACVLLATACGISEGDLLATTAPSNDTAFDDGNDGFDTAVPDADIPEAAVGLDQGSAVAVQLSGGQVDLSLDRFDIDCSDEGLGSDDTVFFAVAHVVVDGNLGALCFGESGPTLIRSWETLAAITPPDQLRDLGLFGGFEADDETGGTTLAFVNTLDDAGTLFQMSINLEEAENYPDELMLTMAHEFSHVFTATSPQIDRFAEPRDCNTYYNGEGCYTANSVLAEWVRLFWGNGLIGQIDPDQEATVDSGEQRCAVNPSFFGAYAASNPEEDFAEAFSAYVFDVPAATDEQEEKLAWIHTQPGLVEFRDRAIAANLGPLDNNFDPCG